MSWDVGDVEKVIVDLEGGVPAQDFVDFIGRDFNGEAHFLNTLFHDDVGSISLLRVDFCSVSTEGGDVFDVIEVLVGQEEVSGLERIFF